MNGGRGSREPLGSYCLEYVGKSLRHSVEAGEVLINVPDLCSILGIEMGLLQTMDLTSAVFLAEAHDPDLAAWLSEKTSL